MQRICVLPTFKAMHCVSIAVTVIFMIMIMIIFAMNNTIVAMTHILCILPTFKAMHYVSITVTVSFMIIMMIVFTMNGAIITIANILSSTINTVDNGSVAVAVIIWMGFLVMVTMKNFTVTMTQIL